MDVRIPMTGTNGLSGLAARPLERRSLTAFEPSHLLRSIGPGLNHLQSPLPTQKSDLSSLGSPAQRLEALDPRVSAAVAQPVVDTALRQHKLPQVGKTKEGDAHCQSIQETKPREWQWDDPDDRDNEGSRELVRRVRVRGGEERRSGVRKNMQVPSHRPHTSYLFLRAVGGYIDESLKTVRTEIWDDPDDSSCILIRRQQQLTDESQLSDSDSEDVDATPQTPENGFLSPRIEFPLHIGLRNDNERLSTVLRDNEIPTLKALRQSPPTKLSHLTYTLSEDRSGDSGSVIRQLLSALRSLAGFVPIVNKGGTTRLEGAAEVIWPCNSLGSEFREEYWFLAPIYKRVWVKYARAKISGWTEFPEPLVCGEALEQLGYSDWLLNDTYSRVTEFNEAADMVVEAHYDDWYGHILSYSRGWTEILSEDIHYKALLDLGLPFRRRDSATTVIEEPLSSAVLREIFKRTNAIRRAEASCSIVPSS
ncbi:uncharacterized protein PV07_10175 [Cladophialophora immunda]|uniref:Uncharacterized protein n=1 Tax=Cladophialophora immunda TaxID=569365 RepID=A0A0D2CLP6_9EURO|nr:uncharacterized protein PV07_10175 [Cladophialophora immunda]KIW24464.1 hypothetical protein PV07_10175 [Cladophialophora immunda]